MTLLLGIESSCDETAAAVVEDGVLVRGARVASQVDLHARFGGVIPEVASRSHLEVLFPVVEEAMGQAGARWDDLDAIAVTTTPGLIGCLLVGLSAAKGLSLATGLPLVGVNHVHAHIYGALMPALEEAHGRGATALDDVVPWPLAALVVSGGHTSLYDSRGPDRHALLGRTVDDAAGEAYDKVAALLALGYPGGPVIDRVARGGDPAAYDFPRPRPKGDSLDFSFSGLKTAVLYATRGGQHGTAPLPDLPVPDLAASFQAAVVDVLEARLRECAARIAARGLVVCGGVAANSALRARCQATADELGLPLFLPTRELATDNAVMIAGLGHHRLRAGQIADLALDAAPRAD